MRTPRTKTLALSTGLALTLAALSACQDAPDATRPTAPRPTLDNAKPGQGGTDPAADDGTPVLVAEYVVPGSDTSHFAKLFDLHMLLCTGGRERTVVEYGELFDRSGIERVEHHEADGRLMSVVEGRVT